MVTVTAPDCTATPLRYVGLNVKIWVSVLTREVRETINCGIVMLVTSSEKTARGMTVLQGNQQNPSLETPEQGLNRKTCLLSHSIQPCIRSLEWMSCRFAGRFPR